MSGQQTYPLDPAVGFAGMLAQQTNVKQADSRLADGVVRPGFAVEAGTTLGSAKEINAATDVVEGIAIYSDNIEQTSAGVVQFVDTAQFSVLHKGRIFVTAGEAVVVGESVFAGVSDGKFYNDSGEITQTTNWHISGDLVTSNSIALTLNGLVLPGSPIVFASTNAATLIEIALVYANSPLVASAVSNGTDDILITSAVAGTAGAITVGGVVTSGAGQATVTDVGVATGTDPTRATVPGGVFRTLASTDGDLVTIELW